MCGSMLSEEVFTKAHCVIYKLNLMLSPETGAQEFIRCCVKPAC